MSSVSPGLVSPHGSNVMSLQEHTDRVADDILASLARPEQLSADARRGIIARYSAVLEGNFIYWMTGAYLSVGSEEARSIILDNLLEEVRDCHPGMLRRFAMAAEAVPTDSDALAVYQELLNVRLFVGRLPRVAVVVMMAFFEGFIQRFMPYLADLAAMQGSQEMEYTDVHGVVDIAHTQGLFEAFSEETALTDSDPSSTTHLEGVEVLRHLIETVIAPERYKKSTGYWGS